MAAAESTSPRARLLRLGEVLGVFFVASFTALVVGVVARVVGALAAGDAGAFLATYLAAYLVLGASAAVYLLAAPTGARLDLDVPTGEDVRDALLGFIGVVVAVPLLAVAGTVAGLPVVDAAALGEPIDPTLLLAAIPLSVLLGVPAQELLFRNVCQRRLARSFPTWVAVGLPSVLMVLLTLGTFVGAPLAGLVVPALAVAVASVAIGLVYERTETVVAAWLLHSALVVGLLSLLYLAASTALDLSAIV